MGKARHNPVLGTVITEGNFDTAEYFLVTISGFASVQIVKSQGAMRMDGCWPGTNAVFLFHVL